MSRVAAIEFSLAIQDNPHLIHLQHPLYLNVNPGTGPCCANATLAGQVAVGDGDDEFRGIGRFDVRSDTSRQKEDRGWQVA
jgi:hypothetical protein